MNNLLEALGGTVAGSNEESNAIPGHPGEFWASLGGFDCQLTAFSAVDKPGLASPSLETVPGPVEHSVSGIEANDGPKGMFQLLLTCGFTEGHPDIPLDPAYNAPDPFDDPNVTTQDDANASAEKDEGMYLWFWLHLLG